MRTILGTTGLLVVLGLGAGCGDASDGPASSDAEGAIVVTTSILGDIVSNLVGPDVAVEVLMPPGSDPHEFEPSARQAASMRSADVVIANGLGFEAGLEDTIDAARDDGATVLELTDHAPDLLAFGDHEGEDDHEGGDEADHAEATGDHAADDEHADDGSDPHVFTDPARMATAVEAMGDELADRVEGLDDDAFRARVGAYVADLRNVDAEIEALVATIPEDRRILVTNHEVFGYFADRYGFEVLGSVIPSGTTLAEPSGSDLDELASLIAERNVPAVFAETSSPARLADALAAEGQDVDVVELFSESLGGPDSEGATYLDVLRTNARRIVEALAPAGAPTG